MIAYDLKPSRKCKSVFVIPSSDKILHVIHVFWYFAKQMDLVLEQITYLKKSEIENLKILLLCHELPLYLLVKKK